jgi:hypothetical protein
MVDVMLTVTPVLAALAAVFVTTAVALDTLLVNVPRNEAFVEVWVIAGQATPVHGVMPVALVVPRPAPAINAVRLGT